MKKTITIEIRTNCPIPEEKMKIVLETINRELSQITYTYGREQITIKEE